MAAATVTVTAQDPSVIKTYKVLVRVKGRDMPYRVTNQNGSIIYRDQDTIAINTEETRTIRIDHGWGTGGAGSFSYKVEDMEIINTISGAYTGTFPNTISPIDLKAANVRDTTLVVKFYAEQTTQFTSLTPIDAITLYLVCVDSVLTAAKVAAGTAAYDTTQEICGDENAAKTYVEDAAKKAVDNSDVTVTVTTVDYTPPQSGTSADRDGTNGSYVFTVTVSKGDQSQTTNSITATITATAYTAPPSSGGGGWGGGGGGGGGSGGGSTTTTPTPTPTPTEPTLPTETEVKLSGNVDSSGNITATVTDKAVTDAIQKAEDIARKNGTLDNGITLIFQVGAGNGTANSVSVNLPKITQETIISNKVVSTMLVVDNPNIKIGMNLSTVTEINRQAQADVNITATRLNNNSLSNAAKTAIGSRPIFDLKAPYQGGSKSINSFGGGMVSVAIPYTMQAGEVAGGLNAVYVDGNVSPVINSSYDSVNKLLRFSTNHFSVYGIGYKTPTSFTDIANHWAKTQIEFVATRGLINGTGKTAFSPNSSMTRGVFMTALGRLASIDINSYNKNTGKFIDVKTSDSFAPYVNWAVSKGIAIGTGATTFSPNQAITRQEMAVFMAGYAKAVGYTVPKTREAVIFADNGSIGSSASEAVRMMQMAGVLSGRNNNLLDPNAIATRGEVAALLYRFVNLVIDPSSAQGLTVNDSGSTMLFENGKSVKNQSRTVNGVTYNFNIYGEATLPQGTKKYRIHKVKKNECFYVIARQYGCTQEEILRLNGLNVGSVIHPGDLLQVPAE